MEKFRKTIQNRLRLGMLYCLLVAVYLVLTFFTPIFTNVRGQGPFGGNPISFSTGFAAGIEMVVLSRIARYTRALRSEEKLREIYVRENDERRQFIRMKVGSSSRTVFIALLAFGLPVSCFFSPAVFYTLFAVLAVESLLTLLFKAWYNRTL